MKKCPYCAEEIQDEAIVCKHCGRELRVQPQQNTRKPTVDKKSNLGLIILICVIGGVIIICCLLSSQFFNYSKAIGEISATAGTGGKTVTYLVEGTVPTAFVTYYNANGSMEQKDVPLPFKLEFKSSTNPMLSMVAQNKSGSGSITCKILVDGHVKKEATSSGAYVVVTCANIAF